ncbi:hypothetical protein JOB18_048355 [Solea senegalensis]|uniref:Uncharacterized protein n=1 Tax=Solea senegalensis TaxID=28829 RepID=A0AAV6QR57_SOLSE|nr:hypothetical protein JOB18_048355 [Solea senegalensis]
MSRAQQLQQPVRNMLDQQLQNLRNMSQSSRTWGTAGNQLQNPSPAESQCGFVLNRNRSGRSRSRRSRRGSRSWSGSRRSNGSHRSSVTICECDGTPDPVRGEEDKRAREEDE